MIRDPRLDPVAGDRWRTPWGIRTVAEVDGEADCVTFGDGEGMPHEDFRWFTRHDGGWTFVEAA